MTEMSDRTTVSHARHSSSRADWREDYMTPPKISPSDPHVGKGHSPRTAKRQRAFHSAKDYETSASQLGDVTPLEDTLKRKAAITVAAKVPKDEVVEILMMLGIHPSQPDFDDGPQAPVLKQFNTMDPSGSVGATPPRRVTQK